MGNDKSQFSCHLRPWCYPIPRLGSRNFVCRHCRATEAPNFIAWGELNPPWEIVVIAPCKSFNLRPESERHRVSFEWAGSVQRASLSKVQLSALALSACYTFFKPVKIEQISRPIFWLSWVGRNHFINTKFSKLSKEIADPNPSLSK